MIVVIKLCDHDITLNITSNEERFSSNSEEDALELLENVEEMLSATCTVMSLAGSILQHKNRVTRCEEVNFQYDTFHIIDTLITIRRGMWKTLIFCTRVAKYSVIESSNMLYLSI